jgi:voltage-gated potassium channel
MSERASDPKPRGSIVERRIQKIANARSVVVGLAITFVALAFAGAVLIRFVDKANFPSFGLALWWALQTVTTVGYGDVVPTTNAAGSSEALEMVLGVSFIAFVTAGVTSTVVQRTEQESETERLQQARDTQAIVDALTETRRAIAALDQRLDRIESQTTVTISPAGPRSGTRLRTARSPRTAASPGEQRIRDASDVIGRGRRSRWRAFSRGSPSRIVERRPKDVIERGSSSPSTSRPFSMLRALVSSSSGTGSFAMRRNSATMVVTASSARLRSTPACENSDPASTYWPCCAPM